MDIARPAATSLPVLLWPSRAAFRITFTILLADDSSLSSSIVCSIMSWWLCNDHAYFTPLYSLMLDTPQQVFFDSFSTNICRTNMTNYMCPTFAYIIAQRDHNHPRRFNCALIFQVLLLHSGTCNEVNTIYIHSCCVNSTASAMSSKFTFQYCAITRCNCHFRAYMSHLPRRNCHFRAYMSHLPRRSTTLH